VEQPQPSPIADLYQVPVKVTYQGQSDAALVYVTHDGHYVLRGTIDSLIGNPYAANIQKLDVTGHPALGPAKACVNVVEFSDFECPHCLEAHQGLEKIEPQYPQVRFTFMDYPLTQVHPWAMTAALAGRCAYEENPDSYFKLQNLIFDNQAQITPDNAFTKLVALGTQAGLNAATLQACISSPATKKLVDDDIALGNELHVNSTPTIFVNGRPMVGWDAQLYQQFVSYELAQCQASH
jgi:protein-disulfide isomerase